MVTCPRDHHDTEAAPTAFVIPDDTKAKIARQRVTQTTGGRRDNRPRKDGLPEVVATPPCGSLRKSVHDDDFDCHQLTRGVRGERHREIDTSETTRTAIVAKGGRDKNGACPRVEPAQAGASEGKTQAHSTTWKAPPYNRNPAVNAACAAPSPPPDAAAATATTVETSSESILIRDANQRVCRPGASTQGTVRRGVVHGSCPCVQRKEPEAAAVAVESLEEEESLGKCYRGTSHSKSSSAISDSGGCGSKAAASSAGGAAAEEESIVVYLVPEKTPPAVRIVLGRRPGWRAWDAAVHSSDEVRVKLVPAPLCLIFLPQILGTRRRDN